MLKEKFVPTRQKARGNWRKLPNAELHDLYSSPNVIKVLNLGQGDWWDMWHAWGKEECIYGVGRNT